MEHLTQCTGEPKMEPVIDLTEEYGLVFDGGGARGAYQIGAWKAFREAGLKIRAVAGTSVGALNGALVCMDDLEKAERIWEEITFSKVMDVDDAWMEKLFRKEVSTKELWKELWNCVKDGGIDITPLKTLVHEQIDEEKIRRSGIDFSLLTYSVTDRQELALNLEDIEEGTLEEFLIASACLLGFKNEPFEGKTYMDGGVFNNVPLNVLVDKGYENIILVRIYGPGRTPRVSVPEETTVYEVGPSVSLGSILEFDAKRSRQNLKIGYYDAKRMLYGLEGWIYYIHSQRAEDVYETILQDIKEKEKLEIKLMLKISLGSSEKELYFAMLEASAKYLHIPKYRIYEEEDLEELVCSRYNAVADREEIPEFLDLFVWLRQK